MRRGFIYPSSVSAGGWVELDVDAVGSSSHVVGIRIRGLLRYSNFGFGSGSDNPSFPLSLLPSFVEALDKTFLVASMTHVIFVVVARGGVIIYIAVSTEILRPGILTFKLLRESCSRTSEEWRPIRPSESTKLWQVPDNFLG